MTGRDHIDITESVFGPGFDGIRTWNELNRIRDARAERLANRAIAAACGMAAAFFAVGITLTLLGA